MEENEKVDDAVKLAADVTVEINDDLQAAVEVFSDVEPVVEAIDDVSHREFLHEEIQETAEEWLAEHILDQSLLNIFLIFYIMFTIC